MKNESSRPCGNVAAHTVMSALGRTKLQFASVSGTCSFSVFVYSYVNDDSVFPLHQIYFNGKLGKLAVSINWLPPDDL